MAVYNEILSARYNRMLNKLFSMKGPAPSPQLASEIAPVLPLFYGNECRFLEGWTRFSGVVSLGAVAAQVGSLRLRSKAGSLVIGVIEQVSIAVPAADSYKVRVDLVNSSDLPIAAGAGTINALDNRGQFQPALILSHNQAAAVVSPNFDILTGLASTQIFQVQHRDDELTILPDMQFTLEGITVNQAFNVTVRWRERVLEESEALAKLGG